MIVPGQRFRCFGYFLRRKPLPTAGYTARTVALGLCTACPPERPRQDGPDSHEGFAMTAIDQAAHPGEQEQVAEKGLKAGALGLVSSVIIGVASTAPAYSLAATLAGVVAAVAFKAPLIAVLA